MTPQEPQEPDFLANKPSLLATFYGQRGKLSLLVDRLVKSLGLQLKMPNHWEHDERLIFLRHFEPQAAHDAAVVQLALSAPGKVIDAWATMCWRLGRELDYECFKHVWGYSLLYQAVLADGVSLDEPGLRELVSNVRRLQGDFSARAPILAQTEVPGGQLWLTRVPLDGDGVKAATVYVALGTAEGESQLLRRVLLGPHAKLLMPDLIAHKGYQQVRQYRKNNMKYRYEEAAQALRQTTNALLSDVTTRQDSSKLYTLTHDYKGFLTIVPRLEELHSSLAKQVHNYEWWQKRLEMSDVLDFHHYHLNNAKQELHLLISKGKDTLEAAKITVDMVQTNLDRQQAQRDQRLQTILSVIGTALAVPQLLDREVIAALLHWAFALLQLPLPPEGYSTLLLFAIQATITTLIALFVGLIVGFRKK
ncbi:MAG: hypothetical protein ACPGWR_22335 [Ardenticatenaceae bacterium]